MAAPVNTRVYRSAFRSDQARATRRSILSAAQRLFEADGYAATKVAAIAAAAGVSVDTVYASVGRKPQLILGVIDITLGESADALPAEDRRYVVDIQAACTAPEKLAIYAAALARLLPHIRPLQEALGQAAAVDPECAAAWRQLVDRRAANMRLFAADLRTTGELRPDLSDDQVADIVWATNSVEFFALFAQREWRPAQFEEFLLDMWRRVLLRGTA